MFISHFFHYIRYFSLSYKYIKHKKYIIVKKAIGSKKKKYSNWGFTASSHLVTDLSCIVWPHWLFLTSQDWSSSLAHQESMKNKQLCNLSSWFLKRVMDGAKLTLRYRKSSDKAKRCLNRLHFLGWSADILYQIWCFEIAMVSLWTFLL